jgi:predicted permease
MFRTMLRTMVINRQDLIYALRSARRTPLLTFTAVLALSVGIGLNTGVFTILNYLMMAPPTRENPSTYVQVYPHYEGWFNGSSLSTTLNSDDFDAIRARTHTLSDMAASQQLQATLDDARNKSGMQLVTCNYLRVIGVGQPMMGRLFTDNECAPGTNARVVVLGEPVWRLQFNADPHIVGRVIHVNGQPLTVIGVISQEHINRLPTYIWVPYRLQPLFSHGNSSFQQPWPWLTGIGRMHPGYTRHQAAAELQTILQSRDSLYNSQQSNQHARRSSVAVTDGSFIGTPALRPILLGLMLLILGPLSLVLLLACTNITMLFLSRVLMRRGELAVRLALGAGRARLIRMLGIESLLVAVAAGLISVVLATRLPAVIMGALDPLEHAEFIRVHVDWRVFAYLGALVLVATVASAIAPLAESFRLDLVTALKGREGSVTASSRSTNVLIFAQIAMSFVLIAAAVLFARLPSTITDVDAGFALRRLMTVPLDIELPPYTQASALNFYRTLDARILRVPGVQSATYVSASPFSAPAQDEVRTSQQTKGQGRNAGIDDVSANFFSTFEIPLVHGRAFTGSDLPASGNTTVAVVSRAFARDFWGDADPVGKVLVTADGRHLTVIGVAQDTRSERFGMLDGPRLYTLRNPNSLGGQLLVRFTGDAASTAESISEIVRTLDPSQPNMPQSLWTYLQQDAVELRAAANVIVAMAGVAVLLAVTGLYAVLNFVVQRRRREFGIQMVLGATRGTIFRSVIGKGVLQIAAGLAGGVLLTAPAAWEFSRFTTNSLVPVHPFDVSIYLISALLLTAVSLCAMSLPAFRATRVDPMQSLRNE